VKCCKQCAEKPDAKGFFYRMQCLGCKVKQKISDVRLFRNIIVDKDKDCYQNGCEISLIRFTALVFSQ